MISMVILIIISNYYMAIPTAILVVGLFIIRGYFIRTVRDVKRIEAVGKFLLKNKNPYLFFLK